MKNTLIKIGLLSMMAALMIILLYFNKQEISDTVKMHALDENEIYKIKNSEDYQTIFDNSELYPKRLLEDLERNPEMLEFVQNYPSTEATTFGGMSEMEKKEKYPLFIQWDSRWGYANYGTSNIGISGCGPTCLSMVVYSFTRDESVTPDVIAAYSMQEGYYVKDVGTSWQLLEDVAFKYGLRVEVLDYMDEKDMKKALREGGMLIASMGPGDFTDQGHFIVIRGYNNEGFIVNDPFSYTNSAKTWDYDILINQSVKIWLYNAIS